MQQFNANGAWMSALQELVEEGQEVQPRGMPTKEILGFQSRVPMISPVVTIPERKLGYKFMCAEAAWIMSGDNQVSTIAPYSKKISDFSDDGVRFFGAYGPRIVDQLSYVIQSLLNDQDTRQAVLTIWRSNPPKSKDIPCTVAIQWFIRNGKLYCIDTMRSSDIWLGWPYDIFNFSMLSWFIALELRSKGLKVELGDIILNAGSQHLYGRNWDAAQKVLEAIGSNPEWNRGEDMSELWKACCEMNTGGRDFVSQMWHLANSGRILEYVR